MIVSRCNALRLRVERERRIAAADGGEALSTVSVQIPEEAVEELSRGQVLWRAAKLPLYSVAVVPLSVSALTFSASIGPQLRVVIPFVTTIHPCRSLYVSKQLSSDQSSNSIWLIWNKFSQMLQLSLLNRPCDSYESRLSSHGHL